MCTLDAAGDDHGFSIDEEEAVAVAVAMLGVSSSAPGRAPGAGGPFRLLPGTPIFH